jgi:hypothetical protein
VHDPREGPWRVLAPPAAGHAAPYRAARGHRGRA